MPALPEHKRKSEKVLVSMTRTDRRRAERLARTKGSSLAALCRVALLQFLDGAEHNGNGSDHKESPG